MAKSFSYSTGEYGHQVRVFKRPHRKSLYIAFWDAEIRKTIRVSLGHSDEEEARQQCRDLSDALRLGLSIEDLAADPASSMAEAHNSGQISTPVESVPVADRPREAPTSDISNSSKASAAELWQSLFDSYHEARGRNKKGQGPKEDLRRQKIWCAYFAERSIRHPLDFDEDAVEDFMRVRRKGLLSVPGVQIRMANPKEQDQDVVEPRTVAADVIYLHSVLNWAYKKRVNGRRMLDQPPEFTVPAKLKAKKPKRPVATEEDHEDILTVSGEVDATGLFACYLQLGDQLGWRVTGVCNIRASDVDLSPRFGMPFGSIRKNADVDKASVGDDVPLSRQGRAAVEAAFEIRGIEAGDNEYIFAAPKNSKKPWSRWRVRDLINRAEKLAGIEHVGGAHAWRRKWVSSRKDHPIRDIMCAGGWNDSRSLEAYMHADPETVYEVVSRPTRPIRRPEAVQ